MSVLQKEETLVETSNDICNFLTQIHSPGVVGWGDGGSSILNSKTSIGNVSPQVKNREFNL